MSGGFFRGTSADQDTRFSNKQAKLLKSQKFAPELETLVDMTKVKMDVMRPWIAKRVTELIGFEDEVLINFIYGLLEGKAVNGKEIQISLTGFMERNTGKFMKELWALLLSAQQNVSGIPQPLLDAKEEEAKHKKAETDRIANEIHRNKEREKLEFEQQNTKMGGEDSISRDKHTGSGFDVKLDVRESSLSPVHDKERIKRNGRRVHRGSRSPDPDGHSRSPRRRHSASPSKSSSHSNERGRSRSASGGPLSRSRSISSERKRPHGRDRSVTPIRRRTARRSPSPRRASLHSRRRSTSHSRYRSPSPARRRIRSPVRHRSRSPIRRRSRSPTHGRSRTPIRRRSRSPVRSHGRRRSRTPIRRSPVRYRSRTPLRRRSPSVRRRSPSPIRRRSPSPLRRRSPSPIRRRSPSPIRRRSPSPVRRRSPSPVRRSRSPVRRKSPSFASHQSQSPVSDSSPSPVHRQMPSPKRRSSPRLRNQSSPPGRRRQSSPSTPRKRSVSPARGGSSVHARKRSFSPVRQGSPTREESSSPSHARHGSLSPSERGSLRSIRSPIQSPRGRARRHDQYSPARHDSPDERAELPVENRKGVRAAGSKPLASLRSPQRDTLDQDGLHGKDRDLPSSLQKSPFASHISRSGSESDEERLEGPRGSREAYAPRTKSKNTQLSNSDKVPHRTDRKEPDVRQELSMTPPKNSSSVKGREGNNDDDSRGKSKKINRADVGKGSHQLSQRETLPKLSRNSEPNDQNGSWDSPSKDASEGRVKLREKRKHKKTDSQESDDFSSDDSYEGRKEAKRRRKEERKLKKEKRRRKREERRRRKEERRSEKLKLKSGDSDSSSSEERGRHHPDNESFKMHDSRASNIQEAELDQRKLEIELREKALETLRAKKGLGN